MAFCFEIAFSVRVLLDRRAKQMVDFDKFELLPVSQLKYSGIDTELIIMLEKCPWLSQFALISKYI